MLTLLLSQNGRTCLHYVAEQGHTHVLRMLLDNGAEVAAKDKVRSVVLCSHAGLAWLFI